MNNFYVPNYNQFAQSTSKRPRIDVNYGNQFDISACQSPKVSSSNPKQWRRSSISYFADGSPKIDLSFDSDEIFRPENVLCTARNDEVQHQHQHQQQRDQNNGNVSYSPIAFPFTNYRKKILNLPTVVSEGEDDTRSAATQISLPPFCGNTVTPQATSSTNQQHYNQFSMTPMMMQCNDKKRKEMGLSPAPQSSKVRFRSHQAESWLEKYEELLDFRMRNGHCLVPNQYPANPSLAEWVKRQRYQYKLKGMGKHSSMTVDRIVALEKLGFVWNSHDAVWEERLKELKQYKNLFGNTNVPSKYEPNPQLAIWIKRQRRQYKFLTEGKSSTMTPYRVGKLMEIDFSWSGRRPKASA